MMWKLADKWLKSRLLLGTAQYPSIELMLKSIEAAETDLITLSLKRQSPRQKGGETFWEAIKNLKRMLLPNTAGCRTAQEAVSMAHMARELFETNWIKLEVFGDDHTLQPDPFELLQAAKILNQEGFEVFPYCTEDLVLCQRLVDCGCRILMPWASPIGTGKGLINLQALEILRNRLPHITLIIDAGIGKPSQAAQVMEMGFDAVLLNTAVASALDPVRMADAFREAVQAGRSGYEAGLMPVRQTAHPSTLLVDTPFWQSDAGAYPLSAAVTHPRHFAPQKSPDCGNVPIGLYPIVDRAAWLKKLLPLGVSSIQLRIKDLTGAKLKQEIREAVKIAQDYNSRLFINDYWQLAIEMGAYGLHLGQEDLMTADLSQIRDAGLRLGISTHSHDELTRAVAYQPSYIAWGPIYHTTSKIMAFAPQGLTSLSQWCSNLDYPVVAIGGINLSRLPEILATGVAGAAVLSAITKASDPVATTREFLAVIQRDQVWNLKR